MSYEIRVISLEHLKVRVMNAGGGQVFDMDFENNQNDRCQVFQNA